VGRTGLATEKQLSFTINLPDGSSAVSNGVLLATNSFNCEDCLETGIYFATYDGANLQKLPISGFYPAWSPTFTKIAYVVNGELWIANADSSQPTQVTHASYNLSSLEWSHDGKKILANCQPYGQHDACLIDIETGAIQNILEPMIFGSGIPYPSFFSAERILIGAQILDLIGVQVGTTSVPGRNSPDEKRFAAIVKKQAVLMNADGSNQVALTTDSSTKGFPIWSPDSGLVIFTVAPGDGRLYLWAARADGSAPPYQLVARPIAEGPTSKPSSLTIYYGYSWAP
jgi:hypothetical protein